MSEMGSSGVIAQFGERVVYVSVVQQNPLGTDTGCDVAARMARTLEP
jgi:hypothetical protein